MTKEMLKRYNDFWIREETDRPVLHLTVPQYGNTEDWEAIRPKSMEEEWEDVEARYRLFRYQTKHSRYFGEAFPTERAFLGSVCIAAMLGCDYQWMPHTVWFGVKDYMIKDWRDFDSITLERQSPMFLLARDIFETFGKNMDGSYRLGMTDLGGNLDTLDPLRGTENLLMDLMENADEVIKAIETCDRLFEEAFNFFHQIMVSYGQQGMSSWQGIWCDKRYFPLQSDFSAMISPDDFEKFVVPSLKRACNFLDHSIFHLDGPALIPHVDHLLALDRLDAIQWVPGGGNAPVWDDRWFPLYEKIQASGKGLALLDVNDAQKILYLCNNLSPKGLFIHANLESEQEAAEVLAKAGCKS